MNGTFSGQTVFLRSLENFSHWLLAQRTDSEKSKASMTFPRKILFSWSFSFFRKPIIYVLHLLCYLPDCHLFCNLLLSPILYSVISSSLTAVSPGGHYVRGLLGHIYLNHYCSQCGFRLSNISIFLF